MYNGRMKIGKAVGGFFALDIGTTSLRVVELGHSGSGWDLLHYGISQIPAGLAEAADARSVDNLGAAISKTIADAGIKTTNIAIGIPAGHVYTTVIEVPTPDKSKKDQFSTLIKNQAENAVPMPASESKIDWAIIGDSPATPGSTEVLVASVPDSFTEARMQLLEDNLGLNVVAIEPDSLAMTRALLPDGITDGRIIINIEDQGTDIIVTLGNAPRLLRSIPLGLNVMAQVAVRNLGITEVQARQLLEKYGVSPSNLQGRLRMAVEPALRQLTNEIIRSMQYFTGKYKSSSIRATLISGYAAVLPGFADFTAQSLNMPVQLATPWQHVNVPATDQAALAPISAQFAVAVGLAERIGS